MYKPHTPLPYPPQNPDQKGKKRTFSNKKKIRLQIKQGRSIHKKKKIKTTAQVRLPCGQLLHKKVIP